MRAPCILCGNEKMKLLFNGTLESMNMSRFSQYALYGNIYKCQGCGFVIEEKSHKTEEIIEYLKTEEYGDEIIGQLNLQEKADAYAPLVKVIEKHRPMAGAKLLDVGANTGVFLDLVRRLGADPYGLEPSTEATAIANARFDLNIQNEVISGIDAPDEYFDIITMWDVVEHLYDPLSDLATLLPKLKPGGCIFIATHDINNNFCKLLGKRNPLLMYQHFHHFSPSTLNAALELAGYEPAGMDHYYKSWSFKYLLALFDKLWPNSIAAKLAGVAASATSSFESVGACRVRFPMNLFFVGIGRRT